MTADGAATLEDVVREWHPFVLRTALALAGNVHDAEDIAQEALLAIARGMGGFRGDASLKTWVYRVALRCGVRWLARNRRPGVTGTPEPEAPPDGLPLELVQAIGRLPLASRTVLLLVAVEGLSHREAAAVLGVPEGTVASRLHQARRRRALLDGPAMP